MIRPVGELGWGLIRFIEDLGSLGRYTARVFATALRPP